MHEKAAILLSRKLSGAATPEELDELHTWIREHPQDHYFIELLESYWKSKTVSDFLNIRDDVHFQEIMSKAAVTGSLPVVQIRPAIKALPWKKWVAAAALTGVVFVLALMINHYRRSSQAVPGNANVIATTLGAKSEVLLPDGSKVWLNAASKLHYDKKFNGRLREVYLDGEAYFDVRKDKTRPFIVHTSEIDIKVLGTAFNVKSYKEEATIEATLIHGSIQVSNKLNPDIPKILLHPHEKLIFTKSGGKDPAGHTLHEKENKPRGFLISRIMPVDRDSLIAETSWIHNRLLFEGETFREIAAKMERWYDVKINFGSEEVAAYRLRGVFEDETIDEALKALQQIAPFHYSIKDKNITIIK
ncbi:FecR family protein [Niabella aquatica]